MPRYASLFAFGRVWLIAALVLPAAVARGAPAVDSSGGLSNSTAADEENGPASHSAPSKRRIERLIEELGHPRFTVRRAAANELRRIGPEAFDLLHAATGHTDPEVAASARYLLRQITVRWVHGEDSSAVRRLLFSYGDLADDGREAIVAQLAALPDGEGLAGLCRIARFDRSPLISRAAALAIVRPAEGEAVPMPVDAEIVEQELGDSTRVAATWLRQYTRQLRDPAGAVVAWEALVREESERLEQRTDETSPEVVLGLLWNMAELHRQLGDHEAACSAIDRMLALDVDSVEQLVELLEWMTRHESWAILDGFLAQHQAQVEKSKRPLYFAALARAKQGRRPQADELAERAAGLDTQAPLEGFWIAKQLEQGSEFGWAEREYRRVLDVRRMTTNEAILARIELANMLYDHARPQEAADVLEPLVREIRSDGQTGQLYDVMQRDFLRRGFGLPEGNSLACRYHFYRALAYHSAQDWQRERDELRLAIKFDRTDADVLIAMYRVPESDEQWRASTRKQIAALCKEFQDQIDQSPSDATLYNQWAWLVSNTEGDFAKAVRYSHRSLELNKSGESARASYLDTLGRCYYAAGNYEKAVKYQREAIEKVGYMQVMHRQLALFEKALAEKQGAGDSDQGTGGPEPD